MLNPVTISLIVDSKDLNTIANSGARQEWVLRLWTEQARVRTLGRFGWDYLPPTETSGTPLEDF